MADLVTFIEEIPKGKLHLLYSVSNSSLVKIHRSFSNNAPSSNSNTERQTKNSSNIPSFFVNPLNARAALI